MQRPARSPSRRDDEPKLDVVFPSLGNISNESFCVTYAGWPALLRQDRRSAWPESAFCDCWTWKRQPFLPIRSNWRCSCARSKVAGGALSSTAVTRRLREIARQGMASLKLTAVMRQKDLMQRSPSLDPRRKQAEY